MRGADAGAGLGVPPVLDIAFHELARGRAQDLVANDPGRGVHEGHDILQLVTESSRRRSTDKGRSVPKVGS